VALPRSVHGNDLAKLPRNTLVGKASQVPACPPHCLSPTPAVSTLGRRR
jgi:hypothetical protein